MKSLNALRTKLRCQKGQGTVEYALITIAVVAIIGITLIGTGATGPLGQAITDAFTAVSNQVTTTTTPQ